METYEEWQVMARTNQAVRDSKVKELFDYKEGQLIWRVKKGSRGSIGSVAVGINHTGYSRIKIDGVKYSTHRLIWIYHNGDVPEGLEIDHINRVRDDNRIENLRLVTRQENTFNSNSKGYSWFKQTKKWKAQICINRKVIHIGYFKAKEDARQAYLKAKEKYHTIQGLA